MSSTGINKELYCDYAIFYNDVTCLSGLNVSGNVGIGSTNPNNKLEVVGSINSTDYKFNNNSLFSYLPYSTPSATGSFTTINIDANTFAYQFTGAGQFIVPSNSIVDILLVGAGGQGGLGAYSGGGGAGEVVYYPQYSINAGTYDIAIGIDSTTASNRISSIKKAGVNQLVALGGGNGAFWGFYNDGVERQFPPKAYNSTTTRTATTFNGYSCQKYTMTLDTTGITYGSGTYDLYVSSVYSTAVQYDGYRMFDYDTASTANRWAGGNNFYVITTGAVSATNTNYFIDNTYKGDWFCLKLPIPISLTKYTIYQTSTALDRAPKNFRVYGSMDATNWSLLQTVTGATYTSRVYTNTGLSTNTAQHQYICFVVNALVGGTTSTLIDIVEFQLFGKQAFITSAASGGSGGGGWYHPDIPSYIKNGASFNISQTSQYSLATAGYNPLTVGFLSGGNGGSATGTGRFKTTITGTNLYVGQGGTGSTGTATATTATTNYGDGGNSGTTRGAGFQGVCIIRISTNYITKYNHYLSWDKILNIQVGDGLTVDALNGNRITTSWTKNILDNSLYNNNGGKVGINCSTTTGILEKLHLGDLGSQYGKFLLGSDYDHIKLSHDGYNAYIDIGGAESYFSIRMDYPPDFINYSSVYYYDIITILGDGSGFVGIQKTAPTSALDVNGTITSTSINTGALSATSLNLNNGGITNSGSINTNNYNITVGTGTVSASTFTGSLSGNASTASSAVTLSGDPTIAGNLTVSSTMTVNNATTINGYLTITSYFTAFSGGVGQGVVAGTQDGFGYTTLAPKGFIHWGGGYNSTAVAINCQNLLTSLSCYYAIVGKGFMSNSDRRIKRDIINIDNGLTIINKLQPRNFNIIETAENQFGFIAQEVNEVEPKLVSYSSRDIPNIFEMGTYKEGIIFFENKNNICLKKNDIIKIIDSDKYNTGNEFNIIEVLDKNNFKIDKELKEGEIFINGTKVNDFMNIDYNQIVALNTQSIKELYKMIIDLQLKIRILESK